MRSSASTGLPRIAAPVIMRAWMAPALLTALCLFADCTLAQEKPQKQGELDVTMQIIVDPDAKLPDEVVRKIPLPARRSGEQPTQNATQPSNQNSSSNDAAKGQDRAREARELGSEMSERAKEKKQEAAEQREEARRAAEERGRRERGPPSDPPGPPQTPPGR